MPRDQGRIRRLDPYGLTVLLAAIGMLSLAGAFVGLHLTSPSDGARLEPGGDVWQTNGVVVTPIRSQPDGLRAGDLVVAVGGRSVEAWAQSLLDGRVPRPEWTYGQTVTYRVIRDGEPIEVPVTLGRYPLGAILRQEWPSAVSTLAILFVAGFVFSKRPSERAAQVLLLGASGGLASTTWSFGLQVSDIVGGLGFWLYLPAAPAFYPLLFVSMVHFVLIFPKPQSILWRRRWLLPALYVAPYAYMVVYILLTRFQETSTLAWFGRALRAQGAVELVYGCLLLAAAITGYLGARDPIGRLQMRWVALAFVIVGLVFVGFGALPAMVLGAPLVSANMLGLVGLLIPVTIAVAILRYRLFDVDLILNRTLVYGALTMGIVGLYVLVVGSAGLVFQANSKLASLLLTAVLAVVLFRPLRAGLQRGVDRLMYGAGAKLRSFSPSQPADRAQASEDTVTHPAGPSRAHLSGRWLGVARAVWWVAATVATVVVFASIPAYVLLGRQGLSRVEAFPYSPTVFVLRTVATTTAALVSLVLAALLFLRKPGDRMALYVSFFLLAYGIVMTGPLEVLEALWRGTLGLTTAATGMLLTILAMLLMFLFPSGRFVPRWTRWLLPVLILEAVIVLFSYPYSFLSRGVVGPLTVAFGVVVLVQFIAGVYALIYRYRHVSGPIARRRTKWAVFGLTAWALIEVLRGILWILMLRNPPGEPLAWWLSIAQVIYIISVNCLPVSLGIALLHDRLWDIDIFINRALVYGALTALVIATYGLVVGSFGALFQSSGNLLVPLLATGLAAILFQPLRERLQRAVNRLMYGERDDPYTVLSRLGQRLETTLAPEAGLSTIVETVAQALKLPFVAIALKEGEAFRTVSSFGLPVDDTFILPLSHQGETVGQLICARRAPGEDFTPADRRLLENIARQAGSVAHAVRLADDLQRSRVRLVTAREEERRRLRRDLHDGLGPQLASLTLKLDAARNVLAHDPAEAAVLLVELKAQTQAAIADIRRLVYGLRPPALDELGLVAALREHALSRDTPNELRISVEAPESLPALPAAVEVAAYRIALEALTNAARHAGAENCVVRFALDSALQIEIVDDGRGLQPGYQAGVGLASMRERAAELGGTCVIEAAAGGGTRVLARLPLPPVEE